MNKEILKSLGVWSTVILLTISIGLNMMIAIGCMKLRNENATLISENANLRNENERINNELMDIKYESSKLEPCPMCGSKDVKLLGNDRFQIYCDNFSLDGGGDGCGLRTSYYDSKVELIETWNSIPRDDNLGE